MIEAQERSALRYELKFVCQESAYDRLRMALRLLPEGIRELHPSRRVQSIYLDTTFSRALEENLAGISRREKIRFRWYGEHSRSVRGVLERKSRENQLGWKHTARLAEEIEVEGVVRSEFVARLAAAGPAAWRDLLRSGLEPAQWISYERDYLTTADRRVRLTLDRDVRTFDQRYRREISSAQPSPRPRLLVLELKCAPDAHDEAQGLANRLDLKHDRCSKFVLASDPGHGPFPSFFQE